MTLSLTDINLGTVAEDGTGDDARAGGAIINANNALIETEVNAKGDLKADGTVPLTADWDVGAFDITVDNLHAGTGVFALQDYLTTPNKFFLGAISVTVPVVNFDNLDWLAYSRVFNQFQFVINNAEVFAVDAAAANFHALPVTTTGQMNATTFKVADSSTVAGLPTPAIGMIARVTDADSPSVGSTVTGGGAAAALVWYNGSNWTVFGV